MYSVISLALYNRRQRALWLDSELEKLQAARLAYANDSATPEQIEILRNEKIGEIYKQKKAEEREQRPWNRAKNYLFSGLKADEREGGPSTASEGRSVLEAVNAKTAGDSKVLEPSTQTQPQPQQTGGAVNSEAAAGAKEKKSWTSWLTGR